MCCLTRIETAGRSHPRAKELPGGTHAMQGGSQHEAAPLRRMSSSRLNPGILQRLKNGGSQIAHFPWLVRQKISRKISACPPVLPGGNCCSIAGNGPNPHRPACTADQVASRDNPSGVNKPTPVITIGSFNAFTLFLENQNTFSPQMNTDGHR